MGALTDRRQLKKVPAWAQGVFQLRRLPAHLRRHQPAGRHQRSARELARCDRPARTNRRWSPLPSPAAGLQTWPAAWEHRRSGTRVDCGVPTLRDIVSELEKPGRDPRDDAPEVVFSRSVTNFDDLKVGMELTGTVRNVVDFGAFVDIGVKQDGLVHISKMANRFVKHPSDIVSVGDTVTVWIYGIDKDRGKISLTMVEGNSRNLRSLRQRNMHEKGGAVDKSYPRRRLLKRLCHISSNPSR